MLYKLSYLESRITSDSESLGSCLQLIYTVLCIRITVRFNLASICTLVEIC